MTTAHRTNTAEQLMDTGHGAPAAQGASQTACTEAHQDIFRLGQPVLVCRWRLCASSVLLQGRHLKALRNRIIAGKPCSPQLAAWVQQHIEWTLASGVHDTPDGVLMLVVDADNYAVMSVGAYEPLPTYDVETLCKRAYQAACEAEHTSIAPEALWVATEDSWLCATPSQAYLSGVSSLMYQLAETKGCSVIFDPQLIDQVSVGNFDAHQVLLASDEHGIVSAVSKPNYRVSEMMQAYTTLQERAAQERA